MTPSSSPATRIPEGACGSTSAPVLARVAPRSVARNAFQLITGQVVTTGLSIVLGALLARSLGASDFGLLYLATSMSGFAYVFVEWGQGQYVVREVARAPHRSPELLGGALVFRVLAAAAAAALTVCSAWGLGYDRRTIWVSGLLVLGMLPLTLSQGYGLALRGVERMGRDATIGALAKAAMVAFCVPALALGYGIPGVVAAQALAGATALAVAGALARGAGIVARRPAPGMMRELAMGGAPMLAMSVAIFAQVYLDAVLLSKLAPAQTVGWYGAAKYFMNALIMPATIIGAASYPRLSRAAGDPARIREEVRAAVRPIVAIGTLGAVGTWAFAPLAVALVYGSDRYAPAVTILQVFAPGLLLFSLDVVLANAVLAGGNAKRLAAGKVLAVAASVALELALVPLAEERLGNGALGVVVAFGVSELVMLGTAIALLPRGTLGVASVSLLARALASGGATAGLLALSPLPPAIELPLCVAAFFAFSWISGVIGASDVGALLSLVRRTRA